jgi:magnesium chelatase family protein
MIDRFDLIIEVQEVTADMLLAPTANKPSHAIAQRVVVARVFAATRQNQGADCVNVRLQPDQLADIINFDEDAALLLKTVVEQSHLSARAYHEIQRVARTIVDLNAESIISRATIAEALAYRTMPLLA